MRLLPMGAFATDRFLFNRYSFSHSDGVDSAEKVGYAVPRHNGEANEVEVTVLVLGYIIAVQLGVLKSNSKTPLQSGK